MSETTDDTTAAPSPSPRPAPEPSSDPAGPSDVDRARGDLEAAIQMHRVKVDELADEDALEQQHKDELTVLADDVDESVKAYIRAVEAELEAARSATPDAAPVDPADDTHAASEQAAKLAGVPVDTSTPDDKATGADGVAVAL